MSALTSATVGELGGAVVTKEGSWLKLLDETKVGKEDCLFKLSVRGDTGVFTGATAPEDSLFKFPDEAEVGKGEAAVPDDCLLKLSVGVKTGEFGGAAVPGFAAIAALLGVIVAAAAVVLFLACTGAACLLLTLPGKFCFLAISDTGGAATVAVAASA
jgi:hypothetical protein